MEADMDVQSASLLSGLMIKPSKLLCNIFALSNSCAKAVTAMTGIGK